MSKQNCFRTSEVEYNDNISVPIDNLVWDEATVTYKAGDKFNISVIMSS